MEALPLFHEDQRTAADDQMNSALRAVLQSWLGFEEAFSWHKARSSMLGTGIAVPEVLPLGDGSGDVEMVGCAQRGLS